MKRGFRFGVILLILLSFSLLSGASKPQPFRVDWQNLHVTFELTNHTTNATEHFELWWMGRNKWRIASHTTGRVSIADGAYMFEIFPEKGLEAGGPLDPTLTYAPSPFLAEPHIERVMLHGKKVDTTSVNDRKATVYELTDGSLVTVYWLDDETLFPLQISQTADGKPLITMSVLEIEKVPLAHALFTVPADLPKEPFVRRQGE